MKQLSELTKRVFVAAVGIPLALYLVFLGGLAFTIAVTVVSSIALWEFYKLSEAKEAAPFKTIGVLCGIAIHTFFYLSVSDGGDEVSLEIYELMFVMLFILIFQLFSKRDNPIFNITVTVGGILYIPVLMASFIGIRLDSGIDSASSIFMNMIISVWACDTAAYFAGRKFGKHKVFPSVSPNKTWEGTIAGFVFSLIIFPVLNYFFVPEIPLNHSIIMGVMIGIMAQLGDFAESRIKRDSNVKDSAAILPGHGGFLDRFDSLLFVSPTIYIYILILKEIGVIVNNN